MKNTVTKIAFVICIIIIAWLIIDSQKRQNVYEEYKTLKASYDLMMITNDSIKQDNFHLKDSIGTLDTLLLASEDRIKTLDVLIEQSKGKPCEDQLHLHKEQVKELKTALKTCKEGKTLETKVSKGLAQINVNNEVVLVECMQIVEVQAENEKKRKLLLWLERGGWVLLLALVAL